jgi:hypothetical protein
LKVENHSPKEMESINHTKTDATQKLTTCTILRQELACKTPQQASCMDLRNSLGSFGRTTLACSLSM